MPKRTGRRLPLAAETIETRLARTLEAADLPRLVPRLPAVTLHHLIRHRGLDACDAVIAAATPEQLATILDLDLWKSPRASVDEAFDVARFGEWLETMASMAETDAARTVAAMDPALVSAGLSHFVRVFDMAALTHFSDEGEQIEMDVSSEDGSACEVGGYALFARRTDYWEPVVAILSTLAAERPDRFGTIMRRIQDVSDSASEIDGLDDLLAAPEQLLLDLELDREARRAQQGYMTPADSRAFLQMSRRPARLSSVRNPIASAYFRSADEASAEDESLVGPPHESSQSRDSHSPMPDAFADLVALLAEAGLVPEQPRALLAGDQTSTSPLAHIRQTMAYLGEHDSRTFAARGRELAFLANTLVAGCSLQSRAFTPQEASEAAAATCNLGLECWPDPVTETFLADHDLVTVFQLGWARLYEEVSAFVSKGLLAALTDLRCTDPDIQQDLALLRRRLQIGLAASTPWRACEDLDVLAGLDLPAWASLVGLLDECPVIPAALPAILDGRPGSISATSFSFISCAHDIEQVRRFVGRLPHIF